MANSLGTLSGALIAQEALPVLLAKFPLIGQIATDFSGEPVFYGQAVKTRIPTVGAVQDYSTTNGYVANDATDTDVTVTINKHKHTSFAITDQDLSATKRNLIGEHAEALALTLGNGIMADICALFVASGFTNATTQALSGATRKTIIVAGNKALNARNVSFQRFGLLNSDLYAKLWEDDSIVYLTSGGAGIASSKLPVIHDVAIAEYSALPGNSENLVGVIGARDAIVFASRVPETPKDITMAGNITVVSEPNTGLSIQVREHYDIQKGKRQITFAVMYGVAAGNPASLQRFVTA